MQCQKWNATYGKDQDSRAAGQKVFITSLPVTVSDQVNQLVSQSSATLQRNNVDSKRIVVFGFINERTGTAARKAKGDEKESEFAIFTVNALAPLFCWV